jgi:hypothetical protein
MADTSKRPPPRGCADVPSARPSDTAPACHTRQRAPSWPPSFTMQVVQSASFCNASSRSAIFAVAPAQWPDANRSGTDPGQKNPCPFRCPLCPCAIGAPEIVIPSAPRIGAGTLQSSVVQIRSLAPESLPGRLLLRHRRAFAGPPDSPDPDARWVTHRPPVRQGEFGMRRHAKAGRPGQARRSPGLATGSASGADWRRKTKARRLEDGKKTQGKPEKRRINPAFPSICA